MKSVFTTYGQHRMVRKMLLLLLFLPFLAYAVDTNHAEKLKQHMDMFVPVPEIQVLGPTIFPKPTDIIDNTHGQPALQPYSGKHRPDQDAVFAYASEYKLDNYVTFIESLRATGFAGDIVLSVSQLNVDDVSTQTYLASVPNLVLYVPELVCYNFEGEAVESAKGGIRTCQCHHLYADAAHGTPLSDPRPARTIATIRYELYWLWTQHYDKDRWILLVDARDTFFQSDPFASVPRQTDPTLQSGLLYFFGENVDATRLGKSKSNNKWLTNAYGDLVAEALREKPTICSGATLGEQVALEAYVRAMSAEYDDTRVVLMGADQGFHNFLYYSGKLRYAQAIHDIVVFDQGMGIVNNMGALRTKELDEWGNGHILKELPPNAHGKANYEVLNWDGSLSPVVHQFDRHKLLSDYFFKQRTHEFMMKIRQHGGKSAA